MRLESVTDGGSGGRARLGLVLLHVDETAEPEFRRLLDLDGVALYCTRVRSGTELSTDSLENMAAGLPAAAALLPPLDAIGYACTSGATVIGPARVAELIRSSRTDADVPITEPLSAVQTALGALGARRIGFVSPYVESVAAPMREALQASGFEVTASGSFEQSDEYTVARIAPASVLDAVVRVGEQSPCDAVFVSCTNLRTLEVLAAAEERLGVPVISSNQALAWHMLRIAGVTDRRDGFGSLLRA